MRNCCLRLTIIYAPESNTVNESYRQLEWCLKTEVNTTIARLSQLQKSDNKEALQAWIETRKSDLSRRLEVRTISSLKFVTNDRLQYGKTLSKFITSIHQKVIDESKRKWREGSVIVPTLAFVSHTYH